MNRTLIRTATHIAMLAAIGSHAQSQDGKAHTGGVATEASKKVVAPFDLVHIRIHDLYGRAIRPAREGRAWTGGPA